MLFFEVATNPYALLFSLEILFSDIEVSTLSPVKGLQLRAFKRLVDEFSFLVGAAWLSGSMKIGVGRGI